ncbi:MAG: hemerythrin domain-containing protein [Chlamydiota bacterium]|nr:hemerythrin domain-containing protein [Chlamydiota bacterium]
MKATDILMNEHRVIEKVLHCLSQLIERFETKQETYPEEADKMIYFFRNYADLCHHGKEENQLFPLMEQKDFSSNNGPTAVMRHEHEEGRALIRNMDTAIQSALQGQTQSYQNFIDNARKYLVLLSSHISKEDHCLFPMADSSLNESEQSHLLDLFKHVDEVEIPHGTSETCLQIANDLTHQFSAPSINKSSSCSSCQH